MADKNPKIEMELVKKQALISIFNTDGYQVMLDIMEEICNEAENDWLSTNRSDHDEIIAAHNQLQAKRVMFQEVQSRVNGLVNDHIGISKGNRILKALENLHSALPLEEAEE